MVYRMQAPNPIHVREQREYLTQAMRGLGQNARNIGQQMGQMKTNKLVGQYMMSGGADKNAEAELAKRSPGALIQANKSMADMNQVARGS